MRIVTYLLSLAALSTPFLTIVKADDQSPANQPNERPKFMFVIHGGAGALKREDLSPELEKEYRAKLTEVLETGHRILNENGSALDAVEAAIRLMEDSPLFNA